MKTLEAYLIDAEHKGVIDHAIRVTRGPAGEVYITVDYAPLGGAPNPLDLEVRGDHVSAPLPVFEVGEVGVIEGPALATREDMQDILWSLDKLRAAVAPVANDGR